MSEMVGTPRMIKLLNKDVIEGVIKTHGPITKPEIAKATNLSLVTVNKTVELLLLENRVKLSGVNESTGGRRAQFFEINEGLYYVIGLYYGEHGYSGAVSNTIGKIIYHENFPLRTESYEEAMEDTYAAIDTLMKKCEGHEVTAIGLGVPGVVKNGVVSNIPNIASWEGLDISGILEKKYGVAVLLENDINLAAIGVYYSDYKERADNLVLVYLDQGIGSGLILNKELFKGSTNFAGELSYVPVHHENPADGGRRKYKGDFENQIMRLNEAVKESSGSRKRELKESLRKTIADGLLSIICVVNPEIVVISCSQINRTDLQLIGGLLKDTIGEEHIPKLVKIKELSEYSIQGVMNMCIREMMPVYSLSSRKRG